MTILSIAIPNSARRSVFALSAPGTATAAAASAAPSAPGTALLQAHPLPPHIAFMSADGLHGALIGLTSLEDLLGALKSKNAKDRAIALEHFRETLNREKNSKAAVIATSKAQRRQSRANIHLHHHHPHSSGHGITDGLTTRLLAYAHAEDIESKYAVVAAIQEILLAYPAPEPKLAARLATALGRIIPTPLPSTHGSHDAHYSGNTSSANTVAWCDKIMWDAARLFASLVPLEGMSRVANIQCGQALEWLRDARSDRKRLGGIFLLTALMQNTRASEAVLDHVPRAIDDLWDYGVTSPNLDVREASRVALEACLAALPPHHLAYHRKELLNSALGSLDSAMVAATSTVHGAVMVCCILAKAADSPSLHGTASVTHIEPGHSHHGRDPMKQSVQEMWPAVLKVKEKDILVGRAVMEFVTVAAESYPNAFRRNWMHPTMVWLSSEMRRDSSAQFHRQTHSKRESINLGSASGSGSSHASSTGDEHIDAIVAVARILPIAGAEASPYLDTIVTCFHSLLLSTRKPPGLFEALLQIIGGCASAFGPAVEAAIALALDAMLSEGISKPLVDAFTAICENIPGLRHAARSKLLDAVVGVLSGMTFSEFAAPNPPPSMGVGNGNHGPTNPIVTNGRRASMMAPSTPSSAMPGTPLGRESRRMSFDRKKSAGILERASRGRSISPRRPLGTSIGILGGSGPGSSGGTASSALQRLAGGGSSGSLLSNGSQLDERLAMSIDDFGESASEEDLQQSQIVALDALADFDFGEQPFLLNYFHQVVTSYTTLGPVASVLAPGTAGEDHPPEIRRAALQACAKYLRRSGLVSSREHKKHAVREIIHAILSVAVSDADTEIRLFALGLLDRHFDAYLSEADLVHMLLCAINDESVPIRVAVIALLGRLSERARTAVLPTLRNELTSLLLQLDQTRAGQARCHALTIVTHIVDASPHLADLYAGSIIEVLIDQFKLSDDEEGIIKGLELTRRIARHAGSALRDRVQPFIEATMEALRDQASATKRRVAVCTLTDVVGGTACMAEIAPQREIHIELLIGHLTNETDTIARRQVVKCLGMLGASKPAISALDVADKLFEKVSSVPDESAGNSEKLEHGLIAFNDPVEVRLALPLWVADNILNQLLAIWRDASLAHLHFPVCDALVRIFRYETSNKRSLHYINSIIGRFYDCIADADLDAETVCFYISSLGNFALEVDWRMEEHMDRILRLLSDRWHDGLEPSSCIVNCITSIAKAVKGCFRLGLRTVFPKMAASLQDPDTSEATSLAILRFIQSQPSILREWAAITVPAVVEALQRPSLPTQHLALETLVILSSNIYMPPQLSRVMPVLVKLTKQGETVEQATRTICSIAKECGRDSMPFLHAFERQLAFCIWDHPYFLDYIEGSGRLVEPRPKAREGEPIVLDLDPVAFAAAFVPPTVANLSKEDWLAWLGGLCSRVIRMTCNHHVRVCASVAESYSQLQRNLLYYATYAAWVDLTDTSKAQIVEHLSAILATSAAPEVHDTLLDLIDFMSRMGVELAVSARLRKNCAMDRKFHHRAMRYAELEWEELQDESVVEDLLSIHQAFQTREPDHALGLLELTSRQVTQYAELGQWEATLKAYDEALLVNPKDAEASKGVLRSLHALQEWDILLDYADKQEHSADLVKAVAPLVASASWSAGRFERLGEAVGRLVQPEREFYAAALATSRDDIASAAGLIDQARDVLCSELVLAGATRTGRGYDVLVRTQLLMELEEAGSYRTMTNEKERSLIKERWSIRLNNLQKEQEVMQRCLRVQSLAIPPAEHVRSMTKYTRLCRKAGRKDLAFKVQQQVLGGQGADPLDVSVIAEDEWPGFTLERCRLVNAFGDKDRAIEGLRQLVARLGTRVNYMARLPRQTAAVVEKIEEEKGTLGRTMQTLADLVSGPDVSSLTEAQICYERSVEFLPTVKAYRKLASINLALIEQRERMEAGTPVEEIIALAVSIIECYVQIIHKAKNDYPLQDVLGILTCMIKYGSHKEVAVAAEKALNTLSIDCWMEAIPQLAAQLNYPHRRFQAIIETHMKHLSRAHPHTMLATLSSVAQFPNKERAQIAKKLLDLMRLYDEELVQEALLLNKELIRTSMTWEEVVLGAVERGAKFIFNDSEGRNVEGMVNLLEETCAALERPETAAECDFVVRYSAAIKLAREQGKKTVRSGSDKELSKTWKLWHDVHRVLSAAVKDAPLAFDLADASPPLAAKKNWRFSVPGTYLRQAHEGADICITRIRSRVEVLSSKQRPRKIQMLASDGKSYMFLLKPREDLRLDERCGQMFALVNSLLGANQDAVKRHLRIVRFAVMPLSHNSGLVSWYQRGDTLQAICRQQRKVTGVPMDLELKLIGQHAPGMTKGTLTSMQAVEAFELALDATKGDELAAVLWKKSESAASWLERRAAYARSLATTSMVGHLLGLGDRHPSNVLQDRVSGEAVQIDFGDCFEQAMERDSFPERMPFRLTRQMIKCLGPTGVEGVFRLCSQQTLSILRENKESIEAVFSAYLHDPLVQHLILNPRQLEHNRASGGSGSGSGTAAANAGTGVTAGEKEHDSDDTPLAQVGTHHMRRRKTESVVEKAVTELSPKAQKVVKRARAKLEGKEFGGDQPLSVEEQVARLILQATDPFVLSAAYLGWCSFW